MSDRADFGAMRESAETIRVHGIVQGVGFRPMVCRLARRYGLRGWVANDGQGVSIHVCGSPAAVEEFVLALSYDAPPLARVGLIERAAAALLPQSADFHIAASRVSGMDARVHTGIVPDAAVCRACAQEVFDPFARRYRYPFTNCTHCGPRLSIIQAIPYDRATTTMQAFKMCSACSAEYHDLEDRRFHAQPIACHACGPRVWLEQADGAPVAVDAITTLDEVDAACTLLQRGHIVAIKGLGGFQLACDASNDTAVARLRQLKQRERKSFALMARDLHVIRRYCFLSTVEEALLQSPASPIVIMDANGGDQVAGSVAPGDKTLGFMLPNTPLHYLLLHRMDRPIVLTSGNLTGEPQCIDNAEARTRLGGITDYFLMHNRDIVRRMDDSVVRIIGGEPRLLRRARGYAPEPLHLPAGFAAASAVLAMGGDLKNTFCLLREGQAIVSHHMGDLDEASTYTDYRNSLDQYLTLFEHEPRIIAAELHPEYLTSKLGREMAQRCSIGLAEVQHHHAHIAACMAENGIVIDAGPVIGVVLGELGFGVGGTLWGGEFLLADYRDCQRLATFKPVAARFHKGLAIVIAHLVEKLSRYESGEEAVSIVALSGGVFQNRILLDQVTARLETLGFRVLTHRHFPANDGGLALGQAVIAAARSLAH